MKPPQSKLCASLCSRNAHGHLRRAWHRKNLQEKVAPQERDPRFVRACPIEMHMDMPQDKLCEHVQEKSRGPSTGHPFCSHLRSRNAHRHAAGKNDARILKEKAGAQDRENPAGQSRRNRNAHGHVTRAFLRENYRKMVAPQERECTWTCGRACAHGHATRALLCENLKGKRLEVQPSSLT